MQADIIWTLVAFFLTVLCLVMRSAITLFRLATYLFVGVTAGYVAVIIYQVLLAKLVTPILTARSNKS